MLIAETEKKNTTRETKMYREI